MCSPPSSTSHSSGVRSLGLDAAGKTCGPNQCKSRSGTAADAVVVTVGVPVAAVAVIEFDVANLVVPSSIDADLGIVGADL